MECTALAAIRLALLRVMQLPLDFPRSIGKF